MRPLLILTVSILLSACSPSPGDILIEDLETKYANLYVNDEKDKREAIKELREYFSMHEFTDENLEAINQRLYKIQDGHVVLYDSRPEKNINYQSNLQFFPGSHFISSCERCTPKLPSGKYTLKEINGKSLESYLEDQKYSVSYSSIRGRNYRILERLRLGHGPLDAVLKVASANGEIIETRLKWEKKEKENPQCVFSEKLGNGLFKLNIMSLWCDDLTSPGLEREAIFENFRRQFEKATSEIGPSDKIIIDLRENGGGGDEEVEFVLNTFFEKSIYVDKYQYLRKTHPGTMKWLEKYWPFPLPLWSEVEHEYTDQHRRPKKTFFTNRLVALISPGCFSSCETIASVLKIEKRALVVGETTHGGAGDPVAFAIRGTPYSINLPTCVVWQKDGTLYEGNGVKPDMEQRQKWVTLTDDVLQMAIGLAL